jgi:hypothetical protein
MMARWHVQFTLLLGLLLGDVCFISWEATGTVGNFQTFAASDSSASNDERGPLLRQYQSLRQRLLSSPSLIASATRARVVRSAADNVKYAIAGLKILGFLSEASEHLLPVQIIAGVVQTLLEEIYPELEGNPKHAMRDIVYEERVKQQNNTLIGIQDVFRSIKNENTSDIMVARRSLESLRHILMANRCQFTRRDNVRASAAFFVEFATIHIAVSQMLILTDPSIESWPTELQAYVQKYIAYAKYVVQEEAKHNRLNVWGTESNIMELIQLLPADIQQEIPKRGAILEGEAVAFRLAPMSYINNGILSFIWSSIWDTSDRTWLSCWKSRCDYRTCPGTDNPMERGDSFRNHWRCRGEIFFLKGIDGNDGIIRACDRVGIFYWENGGAYNWFGSDARHPTSLKWRKSRCPGAYASSMRNGECADTAWRINVHGRQCGVPITDRDTVQLVSAHTGQPLSVFDTTYSFPRFVIYRSGVERDNYINGATDCN